MARAFLRARVPLYCVTRTTESQLSFFEETGPDSGRPVFCEAFDICDRTRSREALDRLDSGFLKRYPPVLAIYNAGYFFGPGRLFDEPDGETDRTMAVNVLAPLFWATRLSRYYLSRNEGGHLFLASGVGRAPRAGWGSYGVSKGALEALSSQLAADLPVPCYSLSLNPGGVATDMRKRACPEEDPATLPGAEEVGTRLASFAQRLISGEGRSFNGARLTLEALP